jgi:hypothetical protein
MDDFPAFPPIDDGQPASRIECLQFWAILGAGVIVWILILTAIGYWVAGASPDLGAYLHGILAGALIGSVAATWIAWPALTRYFDAIGEIERAHDEIDEINWRMRRAERALAEQNEPRPPFVTEEEERTYADITPLKKWYDTSGRVSQVRYDLAEGEGHD